MLRIARYPGKINSPGRKLSFFFRNLQKKSHRDPGKHEQERKILSRILLRLTVIGGICHAGCDQLRTPVDPASEFHYFRRGELVFSPEGLWEPHAAGEKCKSPLWQRRALLFFSRRQKIRAETLPIETVSVREKRKNTRESRRMTRGILNLLAGRWKRDVNRITFLLSGYMNSPDFEKINEME